MKTVICKEKTEAAKVLVLGSFNADLVVKTPRFPQPGESLIGGPFAIGAGGKGSNQAVAAAKLGANVTMVAKIGTDVFSNLAMDVLQGAGIDTSKIVRDAEVATGVAVIEVENDTAENSIVVAPGANESMTVEDVEAANDAFVVADVFLTQLENNVEINEYAIAKAKEMGKTVILNPAPAKIVSDETLGRVDYITPNETEAEFYTGIKIETREDMDKAAAMFKSKGVKNVLITLGSRGVYVNSEEAGLVDIIPSCKVENPVDTTGAGDSFNGALAAGLAAGCDLRTAIEFGCAVAAVAVSRNGAAASMPTFDEAYAVYMNTNVDATLD